MNAQELIEKALPTSIGVIIGSSVSVVLFFLGKHFESKKDKNDRKLKVYSKVNALTYTLVNKIGEKDYHKVQSNYYICMKRIVIMNDDKVKYQNYSDNSFNSYLAERNEVLNLLSLLNEYIYEYSYLSKRKDVVNALHKLLETDLDSDFDFQFTDIHSAIDANIKMKKLLDNITLNIKNNIVPKIKVLLELFDNNI